MGWGGDIPALSAMNVKDGYIEFNDETHYGSEELYSVWMSQGDCKKDDIVLTMEAPMGNVALIPDNNKYILSQRVILIKFNENKVNSQYMYQYLKSPYFQNQMNKYSTGTTAKGIKQKNLIKIKLKIPTLEEQKSVSNFLKVIDQKIELMERKYHTNLKVKHNLTTNLFSKLSTDKPNYKFDDSTWDNNALNKLGITYSGLTGKNKNDFNTGSSYFIPYKAIFDSEIIDTNKLEFVDVEPSEKQNAVQKYDILFTSSSETPEEVAMNSILLEKYKNCYLNSFSFGYRLTSEVINPIFLNYYLRSPMLRKEFYKIAQGSTRFNISKKEIMKINIKYPPLDIQNKIVEFIINLNRNISYMKKEIELNKEFKRSLLSKMFC